MKPSDVIIQLRAAMPPIGGVPWGDRIAGAAEFAAVKDKERLATPSLFVLLGNDTAIDNAPRGSIYQTITDRFIIIAVLENTDRRGQGPQELVQDIRTGLWGSLINWPNPPPPGEYQLKYTGGQFFNADRGRYFHQFNFHQERVICTEDGISPSLDNFNTLFTNIDPTTTAPGVGIDSLITDLYNP